MCSPKGVFAHSAEKSTIAARNIRGVTGVATRQSVRLQQQELQAAPKKLQTSSRSWIRVLGLLGLDAHMQREWLADCYRMRLDDEYSWQGSVRSGSLYDGSEAREIAQDFLVFCRLAQDRSVIPSNWSWSQFLKVASEHLMSAFEKSDAREKYGGENIFTPMMGGRRSLR